MYAASVSTITTICEEASRAAAVSSTKTEAIQFVGNKADTMEQSGLGVFAKLTPIGGVSGPHGATGCTLEVLARSNTDTSGSPTAIDVSQGQSLGALSPSQSNNAANMHYEYRVTGKFTVTPFLNMQGIPFVGQVGAIGAPTQVTYMATTQIENVNGLDQ